jgi:hypothetical protein
MDAESHHVRASPHLVQTGSTTREPLTDHRARDPIRDGPLPLLAPGDATPLNRVPAVNRKFTDCRIDGGKDLVAPLRQRAWLLFFTHETILCRPVLRPAVPKVP